MSNEIPELEKELNVLEGTDKIIAKNEDATEAVLLEGLEILAADKDNQAIANVYVPGQGSIDLDDINLEEFAGHKVETLDYGQVLENVQNELSAVMDLVGKGVSIEGKKEFGLDADEAEALRQAFLKNL